MNYFMYNRKSLEDKERQVLSLESQQRENARLCQSTGDVSLVEILCEEKSAKKTGRPVFDNMIRRIRAGEADGIIAWNPDRLARNPVDAGTIVHLLDTGVLKDLKFATYSFENTPQGKFMLGIMLVNAKYESDYLTQKVSRGMRGKAFEGWLPNRPVTGYRNAVGRVPIVPDPDRFTLVRRVFKRFLAGAASPRRLWKRATTEWGLTSRDGRPLTLSAFYYMLGNPFYAGVITWAGETYPGKHKRMITFDEFERVQGLLGRPGRPRPKVRSFAYTGLIRCGECGASITAEEKVNRYKSRYTYYHCTHRRTDYDCRQPVIEVKALEEQVLRFLEGLSLHPEIERWVLDRMQRAATEEDATETVARRSAAESLGAVERQLRNLTDLRLRDMLADAEFVDRRADLERRRLQLREAVEHTSRAEPWFEPARTLILFRNHAAPAFKAGTLEQRRLIVENVGSNLVLRNKELRIDARSPFAALAGNASIPSLCSFLEDVRTFVRDPANAPRLALMQQIVRRPTATT